MIDPSAQHNMPCIICNGREWKFLYDRCGYDYLKCNACGLIKTDPLPTDEDVRRHHAYHAQEGHYQLSVKCGRKDSVHQAIYDYASAFVTQNMEHPRVLDLGCYTGALLDCFQADGWETWGVELQPQAAEIAKTKHADRIFCGQIEDFKVPEFGSFDCVTAVGSIEHLSNPEVMLRVAKEALRRGGLIILQTPNTASLPAKLLGRHWPCYFPVEHIYHFSARNLRKFLKKNSIETCDVKSHWKYLEFNYFYSMSITLWPELHGILGPMYRIMPEFIRKSRLPMYGGEMLLAARKV